MGMQICACAGWLVQRRQGHVPSQSKRKTCSHDISLSLDGKLSNGRRKETGQFTYIELVDELLNGIFVASEVLGRRRHPCNVWKDDLD